MHLPLWLFVTLIYLAGFWGLLAGQYLESDRPRPYYQQFLCALVWFWVVLFFLVVMLADTIRPKHDSRHP